MIQNIKKFFEFSHTEIRGFFILLIIMVLALLTPFLMNIFSVQKPLTFEQEKKSLDSLVTLLAKQKVIVEELQIKDTIFQKRQFQKKDTVYQAIFVKKTENIASFELNQASAEELKQIKGIGEKLSVRIVNYREKLGGFYDKKQVYEVYGLDSLVVNILLKHTTLDKNLILKIHLNKPYDKAFFKELLKHPYLVYEDVKAIFNWQRKNGDFHRKEDIIQAIGEEKALKILPYLVFD